VNQRLDLRQRVWLTVAGVVVVLLAAAVFTLGSLRIPLTPEQGSTFVILFALSTFIAAALLVFTLILTRTLLRMWAERRSGQTGSRFKIKMVLGAMGVSLLPVLFMFFFSYALLNRTLNLWFPRPLEIANEQSKALTDEMSARGHARLTSDALAACELMIRESNAHLDEVLRRAAPDADGLWLASRDGSISGAKRAGTDIVSSADQPRWIRSLPSGAEIWGSQSAAYTTGTAPCLGGSVIVGRLVPSDFVERYNEIEAQTKTYAAQKQHLRAYKREILLALLLITLLLIFTTTWVALFLSKQVTLPIQALAEATREISKGNFEHRIDFQSAQAQDDLGTLVRSFNRMTEQLGEGRRQINEFTKSLEVAIEERERRRKLMEAILEHIPTGVISLTASGEIARVNQAVAEILGGHANSARTLNELLGEEAARPVLFLMRRSLRMGAASREIEIATEGRLVRAAVTVSALGPRQSNPGFVVVIDDLTELLRAQKAAAWQEVAQRIAHEIKNPLTPIQLSAQRLLRFLDRATASRGQVQHSEFEKLVADCAGLIEREVQTLESLVDEFSQFARFPAARLAPAEVNSIVRSAMDLFRGRLDGITVRCDLARSLPLVKADGELLRRVVANLIDNAAEAMEGTQIRELRVATRAEGEGDAVEIEISDSGRGISPEDKDKLFLPHFSTKDRGTGLGLAIASRIIAEHNGTIRVEDNLPTGTRFLVRLPATEVASMPAQAG
jgi:two-component system nitrogen regulation sensor histidine kinase NtrY